MTDLVPEWTKGRAVRLVQVLIPIEHIHERVRWDHPNMRTWAVESALDELALETGTRAGWVVLRVVDTGRWKGDYGPAVDVWVTHPNAPMASECAPSPSPKIPWGLNP